MKPLCLLLCLFLQPPEDDKLSKWLPEFGSDRVGKFYFKFDRQANNPSWVAERITKDSLLPKNAIRGNRDFRPSKLRSPEWSVKYTDYFGSGYDKGHLAAAANYNAIQVDMDATFTFDNCMPQDKVLNQQGWASLEAYIRRRVIDEDATAVIVTMPLYDVQAEVVKTIGVHKVWVPTHCGKSVLFRTGWWSYEMQSWVIPNRPVTSTEWDNYRVKTDDLEIKSRLDLWAELDDDDEAKLEAVE